MTVWLYMYAQILVIFLSQNNITKNKNKKIDDCLPTHQCCTVQISHICQKSCLSHCKRSFWKGIKEAVSNVQNPYTLHWVKWQQKVWHQLTPVGPILNEFNGLQPGTLNAAREEGTWLTVWHSVCARWCWLLLECPLAFAQECKALEMVSMAMAIQ